MPHQNQDTKSLPNVVQHRMEDANFDSQAPRKPGEFFAGKPNTQLLELPLQVIVFARVGGKPDGGRVALALLHLKSFREACRLQQDASFDLERAQSVLQRLVMGYAPDRDDCIRSVQSLSARMTDTPAPRRRAQKEQQTS